MKDVECYGIWDPSDVFLAITFSTRKNSRGVDERCYFNTLCTACVAIARGAASLFCNLFHDLTTYLACNGWFWGWECYTRRSFSNLSRNGWICCVAVFREPGVTLDNVFVFFCNLSLNLSNLQWLILWHWSCMRVEAYYFAIFYAALIAMADRFMTRLTLDAVCTRRGLHWTRFTPDAIYTSGRGLYWTRFALDEAYTGRGLHCTSPTSFPAVSNGSRLSPIQSLQHKLRETPSIMWQLL